MVYNEIIYGISLNNISRQFIELHLVRELFTSFLWLVPYKEQNPSEYLITDGHMKVIGGCTCMIKEQEIDNTSPNQHVHWYKTLKNLRLHCKYSQQLPDSLHTEGN